jgi:membrane-associated protein
MMMTELIGYITHFIDIILHIDLYLNQAAILMGPWLYALVFLIVFCETGLVVTPFLPGDSLLFALGAMTSMTGSVLSLPLLCATLLLAALCGDLTNYTIGRWIGRKLIAKNFRLINKNHLIKTEDFYRKHGGKTIIMARFMPIVRTFAPFVAGMGAMEFRKYISFCVIGAILWVGSMVLAGHFFGNLPAIKTNFHIVIFAIIGISLLPLVIEYFRMRRSRTA